MKFCMPVQTHASTMILWFSTCQYAWSISCQYEMTQYYTGIIRALFHASTNICQYNLHVVCQYKMRTYYTGMIHVLLCASMWTCQYNVHTVCQYDFKHDCTGMMTLHSMPVRFFGSILACQRGFSWWLCYLLFEHLLRMRARAKMIIKGGVCTTGCDERELCVWVCTPRIL